MVCLNPPRFQVVQDAHFGQSQYLARFVKFNNIYLLYSLQIFLDRTRVKSVIQNMLEWKLQVGGEYIGVMVIIADDKYDILLGQTRLKPFRNLIWNEKTRLARSLKYETECRIN